LVVEPCAWSSKRGRVRISTSSVLRQFSISSLVPKWGHVEFERPKYIVGIYCSYVVAILQLLAEFDEGGALAAFVLGGFGDGGDVGVAFEELADAAAEDAGAVAVDDPDPRKTR